MVTRGPKWRMRVNLGKKRKSWSIRDIYEKIFHFVMFSILVYFLAKALAYNYIYIYADMVHICRYIWTSKISVSTISSLFLFFSMYKLQKKRKTERIREGDIELLFKI